MEPTKHRATNILIIQTAFIGDVILASALVEQLYHQFPRITIDFLLRKGNESLFDNHPFIRTVLIWDKKKQKQLNLLKLVQQIRKEEYDIVINLQRFFSSGLLTVASKAKIRIGYRKNPLAAFFTHKINHQIGDDTHEVTRILELAKPIIEDPKPTQPKLYPSKEDYEAIKKYRDTVYGNLPYVCIAPTSVWFTKQHAQEKWVELIDNFKNTKVFLLGSKADHIACEAIREKSNVLTVINLAGKLTLLQSAALMQGAITNYVNDSAPLHLCSAVNAPVTAIFCSTIPAFGFTPLSDESRVVETKKQLNCRPCGLHGKKHCKIGTFDCSRTIDVDDLLVGLPEL